MIWTISGLVHAVLLETPRALSCISKEGYETPKQQWMTLFAENHLIPCSDMGTET